MSQTETAKAVAAEERTEETRSFVRTVKAASRRKYAPEEKIRIVLEGFRREVTVSDLCRREGIKPHSYYAWTKEFMEAGRERLTRDMVRDATQQEVQALRRENVELKQLVAELSLEGYRLKKRPSRSLATSQVPTDEHCGKRRSTCQGSLVLRAQAEGAGLCGFANPEHLRGADWAYTLSGRAAVFHRGGLGVAYLPLGPALHTIRFQGTPPNS